MAFPQTPLEVLIELFLAGTWTDISPDVYVRDGIDIRRGRADEGQRVDPSTCTLTLNNGASKAAPGVTGRYSPRNPRSDLYGLIGRNTPIRVSVKAGTPFLGLPGAQGDNASTPDTAALDIVGDLDVRMEATLTPWAGQSTSRELAGKYEVTGNQRSWLLLTNADGDLVFRWSADGIAVVQYTSTELAPVSASPRLAVRATLDVDNGTGGHTVTFYTAPTMAGPWTQLGDPVTGAGVTSVFNSTAPVVVGDITTLGFESPVGRVHAFQLRNGIDGTLVASPDFTTQTIAAASFVDGSGRTWTMNGGSSITNRRTRFVGEVSSWPARWDVSGKDVYVPLTAAGILRRLGQGAAPLPSTLRRRIPSYEPLAYWPMEDGANATSAYSPINGVRPLTLSRANWAQADSLPSSAPLPVLASSGSDLPAMLGRIPAPATPSTSWNVQFIYRLDPPGNPTERTFLRILSTGTAAEWYIQSSNGDGSTILAKDADGNTLFTNGIATGSDLYGQWVRVRFRATQNGGNVDWRVDWFDVGGDAGGFGASFAGAVGRPTAVASPPDGYSPLLDGMAIGHISAWPSDTTAAYDGAIDAWAGETAGARMVRLADEEALPFIQLGDTTAQEQVGAQRPDTLLNLLGDAADADGGILYEQRESVGLAYRDRASLYNQTPALELDYTAPGHIAPPLEPNEDDQLIRNDVTVQRASGSSGNAVLDEGPLSVQAPPDGVGRYAESVTVNLYSDAQPVQHAGWRLHLGTVDEARYPVVNIDLAAAPSLIDDVTELDSGDRLTIANPPDWLAPGLIDLLAQGYNETIGHPNDWNLQFNCTPGRPWDVGVYNTDHRDTSGSELVAAVDADDTTLSVLTTQGPRWTTANPPLNTNTDFETDLSGWSASGGTIARVPTTGPAPFSGDWSLMFTPDGVAEFPNAGSDQIAVMVGQQYVLSGWLRCATSRNVALNINWFAAGFAYLSTSANDVLVTANTWTWFEMTATAPATAVTANGSPTVPNFPPATDVLWADEVTLRPAGGSPADFSFRIQVGGEEMTVKAITSAVVDTFTRTTTPGWGTADTGQAWTSTGGAAADHFTQGTEGSHQLTGVDVARLDLLAVGSTDVDTQADIATAALATGGPQLVALAGRATDGDNCYMAQLSISTTQTITLSIRKRVAGVETQLGTYTTTLTHSAFTFYRVRLQIVGTLVQARVWAPSGTEPSVWQVSATDTSLTSGTQAGCRSVRQTANTNTNLLVSYDNFQVLNPQRFTVGRSVNGIEKSQTAGTAVSLAKPAIRAL